MQFQFEITDHLVTTSITTSQLNPALLLAVIDWNPRPSVLTFRDRTAYLTGKLEVLNTAAQLLGTAPLVIESPLPAATAPPRARRLAGEPIPHNRHKKRV